MRRVFESLTPAVRGDYAKHNCPLDQYVRPVADAPIFKLRMIFIVLHLKC
jgi:hypothetical protein